MKGDDAQAGAEMAGDAFSGPAQAADLVDLCRYPVHDRESGRYAATVAEARRDLAARGAAVLSGFVTPPALDVLLRDGAALAPRAWRDSGEGTAYLAAPDVTRSPRHPRRWTGRRSLGAVAYDMFPEQSPLRALYEWDRLMSFVEDVLARGTLYRYADTCGALNLSVMTEGDELQWHFDQTDFVVSLSLQDAEAGGEFEVVAGARTPDDERYDDVRRVLEGERSEVSRVDMTPGTLLVFEGRHSLHRVSPVTGGTARLVALLSYDTTPGTVSSDRLRKLRYGRDF